MKKIYSILALMGLTTMLNAAPLILVVDMQEIHKNYYKAKEVSAQLQVSVDETKATIDKMNQELQAEVAKLEPIREKMQNPALTAAAKSSIEAEAAPIIQSAQKMEQNRNAFQAEAQKKIQENAQQYALIHRKEILVVVDAIAKAKNADFVLEKATCYFSKEASDITAEVIAKMNENASK